MKQFFFLFGVIGSCVAVLGFFLWKAFYGLYDQWQDSRDVRDTKVASKLLREKREQENAQRLDNGCAHRFGETLGGFPSFACRACGLEEKKPAGPCDHVWRLSLDGVPGAACEKCGKAYRPRVSQSTGFGG